MKRMWVYILKCADGSYYTGVTNNLERRLNEHKFGTHGGYTSQRLPVELVFMEEFSSPMQAIEREKQIKGWSRVKKEALINGNYDELRKLSKSRSDQPGHTSTSSV